MAGTSFHLRWPLPTCSSLGNKDYSRVFYNLPASHKVVEGVEGFGDEESFQCAVSTQFKGYWVQS